MRFNPNTHHRQSIRLPGFDYATPGAYFVTIVTQNRECLFGDVVDGVMCLNELGRTIDDTWNAVPTRFPNVTTDAWVIMPNHVHGVVVVTERLHGPSGVGVIHELPLPVTPPVRRRMAIPLVVGYLKMNASKQINIIRNNPGTPVWQRNYYEHVIRTDDELNRIRQYIVDNPKNWETDPERPPAR